MANRLIAIALLSNQPIKKIVLNANNVFEEKLSQQIAMTLNIKTTFKWFFYMAPNWLPTHCVSAMDQFIN